MKTDNGYISDYLIHWTGKEGGEVGAELLSIIASTCQLLLSYNVFHILDIYNKIHEKMVCFTDVPLSHVAQHSNRYGRFAIAFHKLSLMNIGTQPVFYCTHANKSDLDLIFKFLSEQNKRTTIESTTFKALKRHFYFMQTFSEEKADKKDTFYYEREWRLGKQNLAPVEMWNRPDNPKYHIIQAGYPRYCGKLFVQGENEYFQFCEKDVAFLICPRAWNKKIHNPSKFPMKNYEDIVSGL